MTFTAHNLALAAAAAFTLTSTAALAGNAGNSLGDCYNHVISACNQTAHPISCSEGGMDACDEEHSASIELPDLNILRAAADKKAIATFKAAPAKTMKLKRAR